MGSVVSSILGTAGGAGGTGFASPQSAGIQKPTTDQQANEAYANTQNALGTQAGLLNQLQAQNGLANQSQVYNQLSNVANGTGPNPALALLNQQTGANVANQNALMAGQRGASSNVGLIARQAAMQGANTQQQAVGQAATTQANQSLNALNSMGSLANTQASNQISATNANTTAQQNEQQTLLNSISGQNNAAVGMQSNINSVNGSLANTQLGAQNNLIGNVMGGVGSALSLAHGGKVQKMAAGGDVQPMDPNSPVAVDSSAPPVMPAPVAVDGTIKSNGPRSKVAQHMTNYLAAPGAGPTDQLSKGANAFGKGIGGAVARLFTHTPTANEKAYSQYSDSGFTPDQMAESKSRSDAMNYGALPAVTPLQQTYGMPNPEEQVDAIQQDPSMAAARGGQAPENVDVIVSPGEHVVPKEDAAAVAQGSKDPLSVGERIPGQAKVKGNSYANDTVPKKLAAGDIVIPRSVMESKSPHWAAKQFVEQVMKAKGGKVSFPNSGKSLPKKRK